MIGINVAYIPPAARAVPLTPQIARRLGVEADNGVLILEIVADGPAAKAGMQPGDVVTAIEGRSMETVEDFLAALRGHEPGDTITIRLVRGDDDREVKVTLTDRPTVPAP